MKVEMHEAKTHLSLLLAQAEAGEDVVIVRGEKPVARLVSYQQSARPRRLGLFRGQVKIAKEFDEPLP